MILVRALLNRLLLGGALLGLGLYLSHSRSCDAASAVPDLGTTLGSVLKGLN